MASIYWKVRLGLVHSTDDVGNTGDWAIDVMVRTTKDVYENLNVSDYDLTHSAFAARYYSDLLLYKPLWWAEPILHKWNDWQHNLWNR